jgi:hypothetical protein
MVMGHDADTVETATNVMVRRAVAREKFGREDKSAQMYSAFVWRVVLLATSTASLFVRCHPVRNLC